MASGWSRLSISHLTSPESGKPYFGLSKRQIASHSKIDVDHRYDQFNCGPCSKELAIRSPHLPERPREPLSNIVDGFRTLSTRCQSCLALIWWEATKYMEVIDATSIAISLRAPLHHNISRINYGSELTMYFLVGNSVSFHSNRVMSIDGDLEKRHG
jgi:hypothetical protein